MAPTTAPRKIAHVTRSSTVRAASKPPETNAIDQQAPLDANTTQPQSTMSPPPLPRNKPTSPSPSNSITTFLTTLTTHYNSLSDPITPHRFFQLCKDYNGGTLDEKDFYVAVYRLLFSTNASHLMPRFRAFLPVGWRELELGWLDRAIEEDIRDQNIASKRLIGGLAGLMDRVAVVDEGGRREEGEVIRGDAEAKDQHIKRLAPEKKEVTEGSLTESMRNKKSPANGFRASNLHPSRSQANRNQKPIKSSPLKSEYHSATPPPASEASKAPQADKRTSRRLTETQSPPSSERKAAINASSRVKQDPSNSTPINTTLTPTYNTNLPSASEIAHLGPIYASTRAILSRSSKPYIHALCGQHFGNPAEVQRHHNGQGGRPGCWEKNGKPAGDEGKWDAHASCRVKLADLTYVKVREGYVVTDWGSVDVEGVREGEEVGDGSDDGFGGASAKGGEKRNLGKMEDEDDDDDDGEENGEKTDGEGKARTAKRQKTVDSDDARRSASEEGAAARAAAFGLRARK